MTVRKKKSNSVADQQHAQELAVSVARCVDGKKADDILVLNVTGISPVADFFVLASGFARIQIKAMADAVVEQLHQQGIRCKAKEGYSESNWILLDLGDVLVHLMTHESRDYYRLERLWGDAPLVNWDIDAATEDGNSQ